MYCNIWEAILSVWKNHELIFPGGVADKANPPGISYSLYICIFCINSRWNHDYNLRITGFYKARANSLLQNNQDKKKKQAWETQQKGVELELFSMHSEKQTQAGYKLSWVTQWSDKTDDLENVSWRGCLR